MLAIDNVLISNDILHEYFACDISCCAGKCCIEGDAGAPLEEEEVSILEDYLAEIKPFMSEKGIDIVMQSGVFDYDMEGGLVTPLVNDNECAFVYFENNVAKCSIERAFEEKKIDFQKPISCHLYPVRVEKCGFCEVLKYHQWEICKEACMNGKNKNIKLIEHLSLPLARRYGKDFINKIKKNHTH
jgi:hypothetical protein